MTRVGLQTGINGYGMFGWAAERDTAAVLAHIAAAGYQGIEVMRNLSARPDLLTLADGLGLEVIALHVFWPDLSDSALATEVAGIGATRLVCSGLPCGKPEQCRATAAELARLASRWRDAGVELLVHNHAEECRVLEDGSTPLDYFLDRTDVGFVIDLYWAAVAGTPPGDAVARVGERCRYLHIKDGRVPASADGESVPLGAGDVDLAGGWAAVRERRPDAWAVVERDIPPADPVAAIGADLAFVKRLGAL